MTTNSELSFGADRGEALAAVESIADGRGWCNVVPHVVDDVPDLKVNFTGLWVSRGVPKASFVTVAPRAGVPQPSSLGVLHSRGRLGGERIRGLLEGAPFVARQDHNQRGLLLEVPVGTSAQQVLEVMSNFTSSLCDYEMTGSWRLDLYVR